MSTLSVQSRARAKEKAERLTRGQSGDIDASGWREPLGEKGDVQTGPRVISRRAFKRGGKIDGHKGLSRADRRPRAAGGATNVDGGLINKDVKEANESRVGEKHIGGMKRGGSAHGASCACAKCHGGRAGKAVGGGLKNELDANRAMAASRMPRPMPATPNGMQGYTDYNALKAKAGTPGRPVRASGGGNWIKGAIKHPGRLHKITHTPEGEKIPEKKIAKAEHSKNSSVAAAARLGERLKGMHKKSGGSLDGAAQGMRPAGGRLARKGGGRAKKGMNVNIIIAPSQPKPMMPPPGAIPPPGGGPVGLHQGAPPPPPMMPPGAAAAGAPPPMGRKDGGGVVGHFAKPGKYPLKDGGGGAKGRLEKIRAYG